MGQSKRMFDEALKLKSEDNNVIADFICPTLEARKLFPENYVIWVDTIQKGRFEDTNQMLLSLKNMTFMSLLRMRSFGRQEYMKI
tara:strand:- start:758 stop:1012 length:255 start_codon:yes stop_codon:yes gene_type:complete